MLISVDAPREKREAIQYPSVQQRPSKLGASIDSDGTAHFLVWAPLASSVALHLVHPVDRLFEMERGTDGYFFISADDIPAGSRYFYRLNDSVDRPDPASKSQPQGVHGPSEMIDTARTASAISRGVELSKYIIYEMHVGTYTPEGTFDAAIGKLDRLVELGITAIEIMPIAEFPGTRNWGYDGVYPFAAQSTYGGFAGLRRFVDACHERDLSVVLDVVYNHLGPEGNYLRDFGPYFTDRYRTPWGEAINFDGPRSDEVRRYFLENALYWLEDAGVDALRLDAVHAFHDHSAVTFLEELTQATENLADRTGRRLYLIAESDLNDTRVIRPRIQGGYGIHSQWADDLHHCLHTVLTGETSGYYADFGQVEQIVHSLRSGWCYQGQFSQVRARRYGNSPADLPARSFVVCTQNHDQVGNRMKGERLIHLAGFEKAKLAAACVLLSPYVPLLFMGEEYGEPAPFQYFVSHGDEDLIAAVRNGRREEFKAFVDQGEPPDPFADTTFLQSKLNTELEREPGTHRQLFAFYRRLIELRRSVPALQSGKESLEVWLGSNPSTVLMRRSSAGNRIIALMNFSHNRVDEPMDALEGTWSVLLDSASTEWGGDGAATNYPVPHMSNAQVTLSARPFSCVLLHTLASVS